MHSTSRRMGSCISEAGKAMQPEQVQAMLNRCDREIARVAIEVDLPAWLATLAIEDWECEKRLILQRHGHLLSADGNLKADSN
jgi:hypothetical protein